LARSMAVFLGGLVGIGNGRQKAFAATNTIAKGSSKRALTQKRPSEGEQSPCRKKSDCRNLPSHKG
jgi:hypothetical protein